MKVKRYPYLSIETLLKRNYALTPLRFPIGSMSKIATKERLLARKAHISLKFWEGIQNPKYYLILSSM